MDFGYVLRRAWEIIWKFKVLWIFGILASCSQASGTGGGNSGARFSNQNISIAPEVENFFNRLSPGVITLLVILAILVIIVLVVLAILLGTVGRVGLIRGTMKAQQGATKLTFSELWREGLTYFWRVFGLNLLIGLIILFAILVLGLLGVVLSIGTLGIFLICLIPLLCLLIPIMWLVSIIIEQANVALVVENLDIIEAIKRGWQVFIDNIGSMVVMGLILVVGVGLIGGIIIGLPVLAIAIPAVVAFSTGIFVNIRNGLVLSGILFVVYLPFLLLFSGILRAYTQSAWTLTFQRLTTPLAPAPAPVVLPPTAPAPPEPPAPPTEETPPAEVS